MKTEARDNKKSQAQGEDLQRKLQKSHEKNISSRKQEVGRERKWKQFKEVLLGATEQSCGTSQLAKVNT